MGPIRKTLALLCALAMLAVPAHLPQAGLIQISGGSTDVDVPEPPGGGGGGSVTADIAASRTTCTAPCAIFFDATGTTSTDGTVDEFHEIGYSFNFGDSGAGTWAHNSQDKNVERGGPLAAHVFESAGTYTVKVMARDSSGGANDGDNDQDQVSITVTAADTTYSGTNTICIATNTDMTGCPAGATQLTNQSVWPSFQDGRRYLVRAGQSFSGFGTINLTARDDLHFGSFGSGSKPVVPYISIEMGSPVGDPPDWAERLTIYDVEVGESGVYSVQAGKSTTDVLVLRVTAQGLIAFNHNDDFYFANYLSQGLSLQQRNAIFRAINTFVVESSVGALSTINADGRNIALLGNTSSSPEEHCIRLWQGYKVIAAHNLLNNAGSSQHQFKFHSAGTDAYDDFHANTTAPSSGQVILRRNEIGDGSESNPQATTFGPQSGSAQYIEGVEDVIVENNDYNFDFSTEILLGGRRMTARGNTSVGTISYTTGYNQAGKTELENNWAGPYNTGGSTIDTDDPI